MNDKAISWEAKEYVQKDKQAGWYVGLVLIGAALAALGVWAQWWSFVALVAVSVLALVVYSVRPARTLKYVLDAKGLSEGTRRYNFEDFRAFGLLQEGESFAIVLTPKKRFSGRVKVYFPATQGEAIVDAFGARLRMEEVRLDFVDKIVGWLRI